MINDFTLSGDNGLEWLKARVHEQSQEVIYLYTYLGLGFVNALALELPNNPSKFDPEDVP